MADMISMENFGICDILILLIAFWPAPSSEQWDGAGCVFDIDIIIS